MGKVYFSIKESMEGLCLNIMTGRSESPLTASNKLPTTTLHLAIILDADNEKIMHEAHKQVTAVQIRSCAPENTRTNYIFFDHKIG